MLARGSESMMIYCNWRTNVAKKSKILILANSSIMFA